MQLTREQAIAEHRKMWNWIAGFIENSKTISDIDGLKEIYCKRVEKECEILHNCFLCEYTSFVSFGVKYCSCDECPIKWESESNKFMCERKRNVTGDGLWIKCRDAETWQEQDALARQIANLPERTDV